MFKAETEEGQRIEQLQAEANKVDYSICQKMHQTRVLEHMLARLNRNQLKFDAHLNGMQDTLKQIEKEGVDIRHLRRDLDAGLAKAVSVFEETKEFLVASRKDRDCLIQQRRAEVRSAQNLQAWLKKRDQSKIDLALALRGDLTIDEQSFLKKELRDKEAKTRILQNQNAENQKRVAEMEEAFMELKQVTGAQNVNLMVSKFIDQKTNRKNLEKEVKDAERKLSNLKKDYSAKEKSYQELKTSGAGQTEFGRELQKEIKNEILNCKAAHRVLMASSERTTAVMVGMRQGATGLLQRAAPYSYLLREAGVFDLTGNPADIFKLSDNASWMDTLEALSSAEQLFAKMMEINSSVPEQPVKTGYDDDNNSVNTSTSSLNTAVEAPAFSMNVRIKSKRSLRDEDWKAGPGTRTDELHAGQSSAIGNTVMQLLATGGAESPVRSGAFDESDGEEEQGNAAQIKSKKTAGGGEDYVPTRLTVKKSSVNSILDAHRKEDMEIRKKKLAERLATRQIAMAGSDDEQGLANAARLKAQQESTKKLCTFPAPPTLPPGLTLRDDAMTKAKSFLSHIPDLI